MKKIFYIYYFNIIPNISFGFEKTTNFDLKNYLKFKNLVKQLLLIHGINIVQLVQLKQKFSIRQ